MLQSYKDTVLVLGENYETEKKLYNIICKKKEEELKNLIKKFVPRDKNNVIKAIEEVEYNKLNISPNVMSKLRELIN